MTVSPSERKLLLGELSTLAADDLARLWSAASQLSSAEFVRFVVDGFPHIADPWAALAADMSAQWYDDAAPESDYRAVPAGMPTEEALQTSATWALNTATGEAALSLLTGTLQRAVFDGSRQTILHNADREPGSRWVRHASANACEFCRMVATRHLGSNATYYSSREAAEQVVGRGKEMSAADRRDRAAGRTRRSSGQFLAGGRRTRGSQNLGDRYHDHCHCIAIEVRPGRSYEPPSYVTQWDAQYIQARKDAASGDPKAILAAWRQLQTS
ncbi:MuF-like minor capsid protein [Gordonia phage Angelique]|nr:MuF-like minor capsid protein [Gordonia phage Angelique]